LEAYRDLVIPSIHFTWKDGKMHGIRLKIFILKRWTPVTFGRMINIVKGREEL
jgi:hypothetical protein